MKENYQIYLPYQFHWRAHSVGGDAQLPHKQMKTLFLSNMSISRRLTSTFFPINATSLYQLFFKVKTNRYQRQMSAFKAAIQSQHTNAQNFTINATRRQDRVQCKWFYRHFYVSYLRNKRLIPSHQESTVRRFRSNNNQARQKSHHGGKKHSCNCGY